MTRKERALKIAEFEGWECIDGYWNKDNEECNTAFIAAIYSSFDGLMPIVERVNKNLTNATEIMITADDVKLIMDGDTAYFEIKYYKTLLDALQEAIIYYYANKEGGE